MQHVAVFDTNILLSSLLSPQGKPFRCLALVKAGVVRSVTCEGVLDEFREKLQTKFAYSRDRAEAAADEVRRFSRVVPITGQLEVVASDPDDDKVIECAVVGSATHIVTGDRRHLLPLGSYQGIAIATAADFVALARSP